MTKEFLNTIKYNHLKTFKDKDLVDLSYGTSLSWEFANTYGYVPKYFSYNPSSKLELELATEKDGTTGLSHKESYDAKKSYLAIKKEYGTDAYIEGDIIYTDDGIITSDNILLKDYVLPERIKKCLVEEKIENHFLFASVGQGGFSTRTFPIKEVQEDILDNYNDDLPLDKFKEFIDMDKSGIAIMHGIPGTGILIFLN